MKYKDVAHIVIEHIRCGYSNKKSAEMAGITAETYYEWLRTHEEFAALVKQAKEEHLNDIADNVERSLYEKAIGYKVTKERTEYVSNAEGKPMIAKQLKYKDDVPPDTQAAIFLLTNIRPDKWKNRQSVEGKQEIETAVKFKGFSSVLPNVEDIEEIVKREEEEKRKRLNE